MPSIVLCHPNNPPFAAQQPLKRMDSGQSVSRYVSHQRSGGKNSPWARIMSPIGWAYSEKSSGPRTEPCGTRSVRVVVLDGWPPITIRCVRSGDGVIKYKLRIQTV